MILHSILLSCVIYTRKNFAQSINTTITRNNEVVTNIYNMSIPQLYRPMAYHKQSLLFLKEIDTFILTKNEKEKTITNIFEVNQSITVKTGIHINNIFTNVID